MPIHIFFCFDYSIELFHQYLLKSFFRYFHFHSPFTISSYLLQCSVLLNGHLAHELRFFTFIPLLIRLHAFVNTFVAFSVFLGPDVTRKISTLSVSLFSLGDQSMFQPSWGQLHAFRKRTSYIASTGMSSLVHSFFSCPIPMNKISSQ